MAVLWVNNDFGKGGRDAIFKELAARNIKVVADVSTESGQVDFAADVVKLKAANADAIFVYTNEEECARFLREARKQGVKQAADRRDHVLSQKVIELAGDAANGVKGHVGLTADAPIPACSASATNSRSASTTCPTTTASRATPRSTWSRTRPRRSASSTASCSPKTMHGLTITPKQEPGILIETTWDDKGDIDRISFLVEVMDGKQKVVQTLPKLGKYGLADFLQLAVAGLATGGIYALVAIGFVLLWQTSQTINFAQGEFVMLPAFFVLAAMKFGGLAFPLALLVGLLVALLVLGLLFKRAGGRPDACATASCRWSSRPSRSRIFLKESVKEFYAAEAQAFPAAWATTNLVDRRRGDLGAEPGHHRGGGRRRRAAAVFPRRHAHRPPDAGHGAEPDCSRACSAFRSSA